MSIWDDLNLKDPAEADDLQVQPDGGGGTPDTNPYASRETPREIFPDDAPITSTLRSNAGTAPAPDPYDDPTTAGPGDQDDTNTIQSMMESETRQTGTNTTDARPRTPTPVAGQAPMPFTPLPEQASPTAMANVNLRRPGAFPGRSSGPVVSGRMFGRAGGLMGGGLGVPSGGMEAEEEPELSAILRSLMPRRR